MNVRCRFLALLLALPALAAVGAKPAGAFGASDAIPLLVDPNAPASPAAGPFSGPFADTSYYGGTVWSATHNCWEAIKGGTWTFQSGVGSSLITQPGGCKPVGYHDRMEGWRGLDLTHDLRPWFRRSDHCPIQGNYSAWCGVTAAEAESLCYAAGQGYGNNWEFYLTQTFFYAGSGSVVLQYAYALEGGPSFDGFRVIVEWSADNTCPGCGDYYVNGHVGGVSGVDTITLRPGVELPTTPGPVTLRFKAYSDSQYSDEDGGFPTSCGLVRLDDIRLSGAITSFCDFETGDGGWRQYIPTCGPGGEWSNLRALSTLPPPLSFCPCAMSDTVMIFANTNGDHQGTPYTEDLAVSPWIDLLAGGDVGRPGKIIVFDGYFDLPLTNYVLVTTKAQWEPDLCENGRVRVSPLTGDGFVRFFGGSPICTGPGNPMRIDYSSVIPSTAERVRLAIGIWDYCNDYSECTGVSNSTPWFDNIRLGVYGAPGAPFVTLRTIDVLQDNFSADGTLGPASSGRVDVTSLLPPARLQGDTLVVRGDGGNTEVRVAFRVRPGPFTNTAALAAWAASKWTTEPGLGAGWYSARLDTAERGGVRSAGQWMGALHESDPKFGGGTDTDRGGDGDASQLSHDVFPDHVLTPGARIDYFVKARYLPPDPRNPGGTAWYITPDTTGGRYLEMEILPSSMAADTTWNCALYVNRHADRSEAERRLEEQGLTAALGPGGVNAEATRFDRFDVQSPGVNGTFGRPALSAQYGAALQQLAGYTTVAWHAGNISQANLTSYDADVLKPWLVTPSTFARRFWATGDGLARSIAVQASPPAVDFLNNVCGVRYTCDTIRLATCPAGSVLDSTFCLPLASVAGAAFVTTLPVSARGNGCPELRSFDLITNNTSVATAQGQLAYAKAGGNKNYASVTNAVSGAADYRTVVDGVAVGALRDPNGNAHAPARCDIITPAVARATDVLTWFNAPGAPALCSPGNLLTDAAPGPPGGGPPMWRTTLGGVYPNPMNPTTRIAFTNGRAGERVRLQVFDVTGRLVRTLLDAPQPAGPQQVTWDGRDEDGAELGSGLYFVRMATREVVQTRKVVLAK